MEKNPLQLELERLTSNGTPILDLSDTNFHRNGYVFPREILEPLMQDYLRERSYDPDSKGDRAARESIAAYYERSRAPVDPSNIIITASSSESYSLLFSHLASPGDNVLLPSPTYPLFEYLARYARLDVRYYAMPHAGGYRIDVDSAARAIDRRTRLLVLISPNNPTGQVAGGGELRALLELCERHRLSLVVDEVFSEFLYPVHAGSTGIPSAKTTAPEPLHARAAAPELPRENGAPPKLPRPAALGSPVNVFTLNGISKMFACPDLKLGWIAASGAGVEEAIERLEVVNDTYLNCSSLTQYLLPALFEQGGDFTRRMVESLHRKRDLLVETLAGRAGISVVPPTGGIHCPIRIAPRETDDETFALELLKRRHVYVHPGYFYGLSEERGALYLVASFLGDESGLRSALSNLVELVAESGS